MAEGYLRLSIPNQVSPVKEMYSPAMHLHVTLKFPCLKSYAKGKEGIMVRAMILENCWNEEIQALKIELPATWRSRCNNKIPHMTISHKTGVKPFKSNEMLEGKHESKKVNKLIELICDYYSFNEPPPDKK